MPQENESERSGSAKEPDRSVGLDALEANIDEIKTLLTKVVGSVSNRKPEYSLPIHQAEWHIRGLIYHSERMLDLYRTVADEVGTRALGIEKVDMLLMHSREMQDLLFEFYALVNLARITLDETIKYIRPLFAQGAQLPKSINDFLNGESDCPLISRLAGEYTLRYLVDLRNCIVHYRTFATSDNTLVVSDDMDESMLEELDADLEHFRSVTRIYFRRAGGVKVVVNILLPDAIFDESGATKKLARPFSYSMRINLLSQSREFVRLAFSAVAIALELLATHEEAAFSWTRRRQATPGQM